VVKTSGGGISGRGRFIQREGAGREKKESILGKSQFILFAYLIRQICLFGGEYRGKRKKEA